MKNLMLLFLLFTFGSFNAESNVRIDTLNTLFNIFADLKNSSGRTYSFTSEYKRSNGTSEKVTGHMSVDNKHTFMLNECEAYTIVMNARYFYKADHRQHSILFIDMDHNYDKYEKKKLFEDMFQGAAVDRFGDSLTLSYARFTQFHTSTSGLLTADIQLPPGAPAKNLYLVYDTKKKEMVEMVLQVSPGAQAAAGDKIVVQCYDFKPFQESGNATAGKYYQMNKGKPQFLKYSGYQQKTNLN